ncbi:MAG: UvrB/UvrC motif-containing protein [Patescibacteria group bacterium]|nr:UvrB/UvrC motif-containing protein [Patescibacteria group bacterium]
MKRKDYKKLPETPGVYLMKDTGGKILYVGKAGNLRRRVSSYFERPHDVRIEKLVSKIASIDFEETDSTLEALIREARLIRELTPPFNVKEKDDKSFLYIEITKEKFPRVLLARGHDVGTGNRKPGTGNLFGPFTSATGAREALRILRRIFPWSTHETEGKSGKKKEKRACFDYELGLCPGTCIGAISEREYKKNIAHLKLFLEGKKKKLIAALEKEMAAAAKTMEFEKAAKLRGQVFALKHIRDTALMGKEENGEWRTENGTRFRIEGYDISNISGTAAVGSMVVFENDQPDKNEYRKFKIKTVFQPNDVGMLTEMLERRFRHSPVLRSPFSILHPWPLPGLILIDGGLAQVNAANKVLLRAGLKIPVVGIAKGPERKRNDIIGLVPKGVKKETLIRVRNEAHRFAISYHKKLRGVNALH